MLDWLKKIIGDSYTDEIDEKASNEIGKRFVSKENYDTVNGEKKKLDAQVITDKKSFDDKMEERDKQLEALKKVDVKGWEEKIGELQAENKTAKDEYDVSLKQNQLDSKLDLRLSEEGAVNIEAVKTLLDLSKISLDGKNLIGVDEQLKALKESEKWAFGTVIPGKTGMEQGGKAGDEKTIAETITEQMFPKRE